MEQILNNFFSNMKENTFIDLLQNNKGFAELYTEQHKVNPIFNIEKLLMGELITERIPYVRIRRLLSLAIMTDTKLSYGLLANYLFKRVGSYNENYIESVHSKVIIELFFITIEHIDVENLKELLGNRFHHLSLGEVITITEEVPDAFVIPKLEMYYLNSDDKKDLFIEFLAERYNTAYRDIDTIFLSIFGDDKAPDKDNLIEHFYTAVKYCFKDDKERVKKLRKLMVQEGYRDLVKKDMGLLEKLQYKLS